MKILGKLMISAASALLLASVGFGQARAQYSPATNNPYGGYGGYGGFGTYGGFGAWGFGNYWTISLGTLGSPRISPQGSWGEVINVTPKWIVVQDQQGRQYPISSESVRQFLVRWPSTVDQLTPASLVEVTGVDAGSNVVVADHLDIYEAEAQNLVTPKAQPLFGNNRTLASLDEDHNDRFDVAYSVSPEEAAIPNRVNLVGHSLGIDPVIRVQTAGNNAMVVQPGAGGMTVSQVTLGTNSYARKGDLVYVVAGGAMPRSLNVTTLVLYKSIPLRRFQP